MTNLKRLPTTRWSLVIQAGGDRTDPVVRRSLDELCENYWPPLYAYLRRRGFSCDDAADDVQGFFADLLGRDSLQLADMARGRFRAFLFSSLDNYVSKRIRHDHAACRGGGIRVVSLATIESGRDQAESLSQWEATDSNGDAEASFDRHWARWLVSKTLADLAKEYAADDKQRWFDLLRPTLEDSGDSVDRAAVASELGLSSTALKVAIHRLRKRYRQRLIAAVAETVNDPSEIGQERRLLFASLGTH